MSCRWVISLHKPRESVTTGAAILCMIDFGARRFGN